MSSPKITFYHDIRNLGINQNHWYAVARSIELKSQPLSITLWHQPIVLYRGCNGKVHALEDLCPHRFVKLSSGRAIADELECTYHGWRFESSGKCSRVPYLASNQKLPTCQIRTFPVQELNGFIWVFPGDKSLANLVSPQLIPEWEHLNYIATISVIKCRAHYSYLVENLMDMHHGHLHQNWQAWAAAELIDLSENDHQVDAYYQAQSYYKIDKIWSISQLFFPALRQLHPEPLNVSYIYPNWVSNLGKDFKIYCLLLPINERETQAYLIHFTSLQAFWRLHKLPEWFRRFVKKSLFGSAQKLLDGLVQQDVEMIEEEQQAYLKNSQRRNYELNSALVSTQKLIRKQAIK
ncbi:Rieske 2Fe-2S domain-containing protein [Dapis sp. BLCC M229]|uniref:aromatic ring-hydroxylating dioxygenase subunit alpha n=1 Tax=Dapis sp. BLCC M229 TaxID=3400188 RepID=UPI003CED7FDC